MQDGFVPVWASDHTGALIGHVTRFNRRTGKLTIEITDPEVVQELVDAERIGLGLTMHEVPHHD